MSVVCRHWKKNWGWRCLITVISGLIALPIFAVLQSLFGPYTAAWQHLQETVLADYVVNSFALCFGVGVGTLLFGVSSAWFICHFTFPGKRWLEWLLLLPLAIPAYIIAYAYTGLLDYAGPVQSQLRAFFGWSYGDYWFPEIRSLIGAILMLSLVLYPYVYLIVRATLMSSSRTAIEVSRSLGRSYSATAFYVVLPLARPAIVAGVSLAMMEALADYGTVQYFGIPTFTTGVFKTWFGLGELHTAAQLSSLLLTFVFILLLLERHSRGQMQFHHASSAESPLQPLTLKPVKAWLVSGYLWCVVFVGFLFPFAQLSSWVLGAWQDNVTVEFLMLIKNSVMVAVLAAFCCVALSFLATYAVRLQPQLWERLALRASTLGYAVPGTVIAVGVLVPLSVFDHALDTWLTENWNISSGLLLTGSLAGLILGYCVRFMAVSVQTLESGYAKIRQHLDESAILLGSKPRHILTRIHMPLLRTSLLTASLLVFVDVLKELPATLILRPFNFNTLAVRAYELASDERLADAALPSITIVLVGLIPVIFLIRAMKTR